MNWHRLLFRSLPILALVTLVLVFATATTSEGAPERGWFLTWDNCRFIAAQAVVVAIGAAGMTLIMAAGGIDLSVGAIVGLTGVVGAEVLRHGDGPGMAVLAALGVGLVSGAANGTLVSGLRIAPVFATLGTFWVFRGFAKWMTSGRFLPVPPTWLDELMAFFPAQGWMLFAPGVWIALLAAALAGVVARNTVFGRAVFAVGSNEDAARMCGIRVFLTRLLAYGAGGLAFGLAGLLQMARLRRGDPLSGAGLELDVIAAALIGGATLRGGSGSVAGAALGALLLSVLRNGVRQAGWPPYAEEMAVGGALLVAAAVNELWRDKGRR